MTDTKEKEFPQGMIFKEAKVDFIHCKISIKKQEFIEWLSTKDDEWINIDLKTARSGKLYGEVNNWKPVTDGMTGGSNFSEAIERQKSGKDSGLSPADAKKIIDKAHSKNEKEEFNDDIPF
tara:strand:+ start:496 stop:858 length:363 start_codon:yes stop_codon:yes gene_type:complete